VSRSIEVEGVDVPEPRAREAPVTQADAFVRLADRQLDASYRLARAILHDPSEAQDATHDALVQAWRKWPSLRDPSRFDRWFTRILINTCRNRLRRTATHPTGPLSEVVVDHVREDPFARADDRELLGEAIRRLSPDHRVVVALRFYRDLTTDEIARLLGARAGTVRSRLHYAMKELRSFMEAADQKGVER
jgi:RNA polymerase sigma-70 factor (ECF subfamily)